MGITQSDTVISVMKASDRLGTHQADKENGNILSPISKRNKRGTAQCNILRKDTPILLFYGEYKYLLKHIVRRADWSSYEKICASDMSHWWSKGLLTQWLFA